MALRPWGPNRGPGGDISTGVRLPQVGEHPSTAHDLTARDPRECAPHPLADSRGAVGVALSDLAKTPG